MSYDLMVFDTAAVPTEAAAFLAWYDSNDDIEAEGNAPEGEAFEDYSDPAKTPPILRAWFLDMINEFPAMNGAYAPDFDKLEEAENTADYFINEASIYIAFSWSDPGAAYAATFRLAAKHGVGFFDVSSEEGKVWVPDSPGSLREAFKTS